MRSATPNKKPDVGSFLYRLAAAAVRNGNMALLCILFPASSVSYPSPNEPPLLSPEMSDLSTRSLVESSETLYEKLQPFPEFAEQPLSTALEEQLRHITDHPLKADFFDESGKHSLTLALEKEQTPAALLLLSRGADPLNTNADDHQISPLEYAFYRGKYAIAMKFLPPLITEVQQEAKARQAFGSTHWDARLKQLEEQWDTCIKAGPDNPFKKRVSAISIEFQQRVAADRREQAAAFKEQFKRLNSNIRDLLTQLKAQPDRKLNPKELFALASVRSSRPAPNAFSAQHTHEARPNFSTASTVKEVVRELETRQAEIQGELFSLEQGAFSGLDDIHQAEKHIATLQEKMHLTFYNEELRRELLWIAVPFLTKTKHPYFSFYQRLLEEEKAFLPSAPTQENARLSAPLLHCITLVKELRQELQKSQEVALINTAAEEKVKRLMSAHETHYEQISKTAEGKIQAIKEKAERVLNKQKQKIEELKQQIEELRQLLAKKEMEIALLNAQRNGCSGSSKSSPVRFTDAPPAFLSSPAASNSRIRLFLTPPGRAATTPKPPSGTRQKPCYD